MAEALTPGFVTASWRGWQVCKQAGGATQYSAVVLANSCSLAETSNLLPFVKNRALRLRLVPKNYAGNSVFASHRGRALVSNLLVTRPALSVLLLIPAYNEEERIEPTLREYVTYFRANYSGRFEILVVLNGCRDNTLAVVRRVAAEFPEVQVEDFPAPIGKGGALIEGLRHAPKVDLIGYVDADGATPPAAFHALIGHTAWADCVIGSRWLKGAVLHQAQPLFRRFTSRCFHALVELLFGMGIADTQCPAKIAHRHAIESIHDHLRIADLAFDVNLLCSLTHAGFKVLELPTEWTDKLGSKVTSSLFRSSAIMFLSTVRLRLVYSPLYERLQPLRWIGDRLYAALRAPVRKKS